MTLRSNFKWTFIGNCIYFISQWGMLTVLVKWGNPDVVGKYAYALTIVTPVITFAMMQLKQVHITDVSEQFEFRDYLSTRIGIVFLGLLTMNIIVWFGQYSLETKVVILVMSLAKWVDSISDIIRGIFQKYERMSYASISLIIKGISGLAAVAILFHLTGSLVITLWGLTLVWTLSLFFYDIPKGLAFLRQNWVPDSDIKSIIPNFNFIKIWKLIRISFPLGIVLGVGSLQTFLPRFFLEKYYGETLLGYFAAISYPLAVGNMVIAALSQSALPRLSKYFVENIQEYKRLFVKIMFLGLLIGIVFILLVIFFGKQALVLLYRPDYGQYQSAFILMSFSGAISFLAAFCGTGVTAARCFNVQILFSGIATLGTAIAALILIPKHAIIGASVTMIVTSSLMLICYLTGLMFHIHRYGERDVR
ncbi:MAG: oligosaccharide flippase family protein [Candidatus Methanofastidiosa archaeon]|nr:oligosaccharide flippase family protein [Candidatus Methanofastidiosa archaeon]